VHFISLNYLVLVGLLLSFYYLPVFRRAQVYMLIVGSLVFYGTGQLHLLPLLTVAALSAGMLAWALKSHIRHSILLAIGVASYLSILAFFKYKFIPIFDVENYANSLDGPLRFMLLLPLPIGISFYTFQSISLIVDSHKKKYANILNSEPNRFVFIKNCFFYIVFFPQLVAGPIVKAHDFLPQIKPKYFSDVNLRLASQTIISGLFFKSVIADNLNVYTLNMEQIASKGNGNTLDAAVLLFVYSAQIYSDFFGYTLLAIGVAALFGYRLPENFNIPYIAQSISEFWRRWHISLSSFLREYLYYPLGGNRLGEIRTYLNLIVVMALGGLWHGAAMSYMFWGLFHGIGLALERPFLKSFFFRSQYPLMILLRTLTVFSFVSFAWIFFRFPEFDDVLSYLGVLISSAPDERGLLNSVDLFIIGALCFPVFVQHFFVKFEMELNTTFQIMIYGTMLFLFTVQRGPTDAFIYFQF